MNVTPAMIWSGLAALGGCVAALAGGVAWLVAIGIKLTRHLDKIEASVGLVAHTLAGLRDTQVSLIDRQEQQGERITELRIKVERHEQVLQMTAEPSLGG